jgi:hypothetical protein
MASGYNEFQTTTPEQMQGIQQLLASLHGTNLNLSQSPLFGAGQNWLMQLLQGGPEAFKQFEAPHLRQFNEQTIPGLAERFAGAGAGSSSGFQQALGQAGAGLSENLAALRGGMQMNALPQALQYAQQPISNALQAGQMGISQNTKAFQPKTAGFFQQILQALAGGVGSGIGSAVTGGLGNPFSGIGQGNQAVRSASPFYMGG